VAIASTLRTYITSRDHRLMRRVNRWRAPRWVRLASVLATRMGDGWLWYFLAPLILVFGGELRYRALAASSLAALLGIAVFKSVKQVSRRPRPCEEEPHCWATMLPPDQFSFPSGHTITAFGIAVPLAMLYPQAGPELFFAAACIGVSRVLLGMHYMSDVLAGALFGAVIGFGSHVLFTVM